MTSSSLGSSLASVLAFVAFVAFVAFGGACGRDPSRLAVTSSATSVAGGAGGDGTPTGSSSSPSSSIAATGGGGSSEPLGETTLTVVNGIVDETRVRLCFVPYPSGPSGAELPWPSAEGLPFARSAKVDLATVIPGGMDIELRAVAGPTAAVVGKTCLELATAANVHVRSMGVLPAGSFSSGRSLLAVPHGCMGGPTHTDPLESQICGAGYTKDTPNAALAAGYLSRIALPDMVPMQFAHAVAAMGAGSLALAPGLDAAVPTVVVDEWSLGSILPYPPYLEVARADLLDVNHATLHITSGAGSVEIEFGEALTNGGLDASAISDGEGMAFVFVGAAPNVPKGPFWSALTATAITIAP